MSRSLSRLSRFAGRKGQVKVSETHATPVAQSQGSSTASTDSRRTGAPQSRGSHSAAFPEAQVARRGDRQREAMTRIPSARGLSDTDTGTGMGAQASSAP
ncbi:hypothetical protein KIPB_002621 [Kipferlia bialata]|uniref:Uncharacterized protein n=1 Tax=Kipferlia bialata TaxID=797122 RepID=A0A391NJG9_9EUKA|nr:hypothetical protein KIPB_002621 [Kipferlia bialata]|eukprot:g2621.t1